MNRPGTGGLGPEADGWASARRTVLWLILASGLSYALALVLMPSAYSLSEPTGNGCNDLVIGNPLPIVLSYAAYAALLAAIVVWAQWAPLRRESEAREAVGVLSFILVAAFALAAHGAQGYLTVVVIYLAYGAVVLVPMIIAISALGFRSFPPASRRPLFGIVALAIIYPFLAAPFAPHVVWTC